MMNPRKPLAPSRRFMPSMWQKIAGDVLVLGWFGGRRERWFWLMREDGAQEQRLVKIPKSCIIKHDPKATHRIVAVPSHEQHRILWLTGPSATPLWALQQLRDHHPQVRRYLRRQAVVRFLKRLSFR